MRLKEFVKLINVDIYVMVKLILIFIRWKKCHFNVLIHHSTLFILHNNSYTTNTSYITDRCKPSASYSKEDDGQERLLVELNQQITVMLQRRLNHADFGEEERACVPTVFISPHVQQYM